MTNIKELEDKQKELIANLTYDDLKKYIVYLTRCYYESYKNNDVRQFENNIQLLEELIEVHKNHYANITGFVYFSLFINSNAIISDMASDSNKIKLGVPFNYNLYESEEEEELSHDIKKIFNKDRIRARYNEKKAKESDK